MTAGPQNAEGAFEDDDDEDGWVSLRCGAELSPAAGQQLAIFERLQPQRGRLRFGPPCLRGGLSFRRTGGQHADDDRDEHDAAHDGGALVVAHQREVGPDGDEGKQRHGQNRADPATHVGTSPRTHGTIKSDAYGRRNLP